MVIVISGTPGAGKSTVSKALAEKFSKSAYIAVDDFWEMIVGGNVAPWDPDGPKLFKTIEKNYLALTKNFLEEQYVVIIDGVMGDEQVKSYNDIFGDVYGYLLLPSLETLKKRDAIRPPENQWPDRIDALYPQFADVPHPVLHVIDSTEQSVEETVNVILEKLPQ